MATKAEKQKEAETAELLGALATLHQQQGRLWEDKRINAAHLSQVKAEIRDHERRLAILRGERQGGRPQGATSPDSFGGRVCAFLKADPERIWTAQEVSDALNEPRHRVSTSLSHLANYHRVARIGRGKYRGRTDFPPLPPLRQFLTGHEIEDKILELLDRDASKAWRARDAAHELDVSPRNISDAMAMLARREKIRRLRHGVYVSLKNTTMKRTEAQARQRQRQIGGFRYERRERGRRRE